jgi:hypothetical protein
VRWTRSLDQAHRARKRAPLRPEESPQKSEIANVPSDSEKTVEHHRKPVMHKRGTHEVASVARYALRHRIVFPTQAFEKIRLSYF